MATNQAGSPIVRSRLEARSARPAAPSRCASALAGRALTGRLAAAPREAADERGAVPVQVVRQPLAQLEVALAGRPVAPRRRHLGDAAAGQRRLDRQLQRELEPGRALDPDRVEEAAA